MYLGSNLCLPLDLLQGNPPSEDVKNEENRYVSKLKEKLDSIHRLVRGRLVIRTGDTKSWYDRRARQISFEPGQKVWFYNPRRRRGLAPKLQSPWEGPCEVVKKLSDVVFYIRKVTGRKNRVVHADRLAAFLERRVRGET